jgi:hypothetical protein
VAQYERLGGIRPFLSAYLRECISPGYPLGALEQEAIRVAAEICSPGARQPQDSIRTGVPSFTFR